MALNTAYPERQYRSEIYIHSVAFLPTKLDLFVPYFLAKESIKYTDQLLDIETVTNENNNGVQKKQQQRTLTEYTILPCLLFNSCNAVLLNVSRKPLEVYGHISMMCQLFFQCHNLICVFLKDKVGYPLRKQFSHQGRKSFL